MLKVVDSDSFMKEIKQLYDTAFPREERYLDFEPAVKQMEAANSGEKRGELVAFGEDTGETAGFVGFVMVLFCGNIAHLYYFAIHENLRGRKYGEQALNLIKERYKDRTIWLGVELPDENAENQQQRLRRKQFYYRNGFRDTDVSGEKNGCMLQMMSTDGMIDPDTLVRLDKMIDEMVAEGRRQQLND